VFQTKFSENIKTQILYSITLFSKIVPIMRLCEKKKDCRSGQATDDNIIRRMRIASWILQATNTRSE